MSSPPPQPLWLPSKRNVPSSWSRRPPATERRAQGESNPGSYTSTSAVKILATPSGTALAISVFRPRAEKGYRLLFHSSPQVQVLGPGGEKWIPGVESLIMPLRLPDCNVYHEAQPSWNCNSIWLHDKDIFLQYVDGTTKILWS